ncbi:MAG: hypothetical protein MHMPM18_001515 [Marteilia pararefringens]
MRNNSEDYDDQTSPPRHSAQRSSSSSHHHHHNNHHYQSSGNNYGVAKQSSSSSYHNSAANNNQLQQQQPAHHLPRDSSYSKRSSSGGRSGSGAPTSNRYVPDSAFRLHIANLDAHVTRNHLKEIYAEYGRIIDTYISSAYPYYAFVTFEDSEDCAKAISETNETTIKGCRVRVTKALRRANSMTSYCIKCRDYGHTTQNCNKRSFNSNGRHYNPKRSRSRSRSSSRSYSEYSRSRSNSRSRSFSPKSEPRQERSQRDPMPSPVIEKKEPQIVDDEKIVTQKSLPHSDTPSKINETKNHQDSNRVIPIHHENHVESPIKSSMPPTMRPNPSIQANDPQLYMDMGVQVTIKDLLDYVDKCRPSVKALNPKKPKYDVTSSEFLLEKLNKSYQETLKTKDGTYIV